MSYFLSSAKAEYVDRHKGDKKSDIQKQQNKNFIFLLFFSIYIVMMDKRLSKYVILVPFVSIFINHCQLNIFYEHNHHQRRHRNLLQGLG